MTIVNVASASDLKPDEMRAVNANGKAVLLVNINGTYYAIGNICTHMGCPLSKGTLKGENVECVCHGSTFALKTGKVVRGPAEKPELKYEVKVENGKILIDA
jgi:nitrite reductase/ring-hydroxylating ferredoxin subunit